MSDVFCTSCGAGLASTARFCSACGERQPVDEPSPAPRAPAPAPVAPVVAVTSSPYGPPPPRPLTVAPSFPAEVLAVCALMALGGVLTLWPALKAMPDLLDALGAGGFVSQLALLLLAFWLLLAFFGTACLVLAWRLAQADRVARGLTYVLVGGLAASIIVGDQHTTGLMLVVVACAVAVALLALGPGAQQFFAGANAPQGGQPVGLVVARTLVATWAGCIGVVGLMFLPLGGLGGKFVVVGILFIAVAAVALWLNGYLSEGDWNARRIISAGAGVYLVLLLILGQRSPGLILPLALSVGVIWNLWAPLEVQDFFNARR
jgi:hypothetical protein